MARSSQPSAASAPAQHTATQPVSLLGSDGPPGPTVAASQASRNPFAGKARDFWLVLAAMFVSSFIAAVDLTAVSTVLPTMAADLGSDGYAWIGTAYALASTALIPWTAGLANIFGRRSTILGSLLLFAVGSAVTGSAQTMEAAIAGRTVQGLGGGGIIIMTDVVVVDLVPLVERGAFFGLVGAVWATASSVGPLIGGAFGSGGEWRWLFYLNVPASAVAMLLVVAFLRVKSPTTCLKEKMEQMDYVNLLFVAATTALVLGISWGGVEYAWDSAHVLAPLILGIAGIIVFIWIEKRFVKYPTVPFDILIHHTALAGYVGTFLLGVVSIAALYLFPVFYQAVKGHSPLRAGIDMFTFSLTIAPFAAAGGASVGLSGHYLTQSYLGWAVCLVGFGLNSLLTAASPELAWVGFPVATGAGLGLLNGVTSFPVLAPVPPARHPHAMGFAHFLRNLGQVAGIAAGSAVLSDRLARELPGGPGGGAAPGASAEAGVPLIGGLEEPLRGQVRTAFAGALRVVWLVMVGISGLGLLSVLPMRSLPLTTETDPDWGLQAQTRAVAADGEA